MVVAHVPSPIMRKPLVTPGSGFFFGRMHRDHVAKVVTAAKASQVRHVKHVRDLAYSPLIKCGRLRAHR
jgi:hypothetical protein